MGTSSSFGGAGPNTPLVPSWLNEPPPAPALLPVEAPPQQQPQPAPPQPLPPIAPPPQGDRFRAPRSNFTRYLKTGDSRSLRRAVSDYVRTGTGGSRGAAGRMGSSRQAAGRIYGFYQDVQQRGTAEALRQLGFGDLVGKPAIDGLARLTDAVCPPGGPQDQAIARDAFAEAVVNLAVEGVADIAALTADQWQSLFLDFITRSIEARIVNDIGTKSVTMPTDLKAAQQVERSLHQLVDGCAKDAFAETLGKGETLQDNQMQAGMDSIYQVAFAFLEALPS
jgi:hypothetical protein